MTALGVLIRHEGHGLASSESVRKRVERPFFILQTVQVPPIFRERLNMFGSSKFGEVMKGSTQKEGNVAVRQGNKPLLR